MSNEKKKLDAKDLDQVAGGETPFWKKKAKEANVNNTDYCITDSCICCGSCLSHCPVNAIYYSGSQYVIGSACIGCASCSFHCPVGAIVMGE